MTEFPSLNLSFPPFVAKTSKFGVITRRSLAMNVQRLPAENTIKYELTNSNQLPKTSSSLRSHFESLKRVISKQRQPVNNGHFLGPEGSRCIVTGVTEYQHFEKIYQLLYFGHFPINKSYASQLNSFCRIMTLRSFMMLHEEN